MGSEELVRQFRDFLQNPYAWPGGYARVMLCKDGEAMCHKCAKENAGLIEDHTIDGSDSCWEFAGSFVNWEDDLLYCANCNERIVPEYSDD